MTLPTVKSATFEAVPGEIMVRDDDIANRKVRDL